uniref:Secreted protein n=1 Tax=Steinernema glaseri TaxID=37863 RepID=A0A1I8AEY3_9BILA
MDMTKTLGLAIKMLFAMQVRVVVVLNKGFQLDLEPLAIVQQGPVMKGNTPRPRIDVLILVELHILLGPAQFGVAVTAVQGPVPPSHFFAIFQDFDFVACIAQLQSGHHASQPRSQDHHRGPWLGLALQANRAIVAALRRMAQAHHGLIHGRATCGIPDHGQKMPPCQYSTL